MSRAAIWVERERPGAGRGQLDGQRQAVEPGADVGDDIVGSVVETDRRGRRSGAGHEESDRIVGCQRRHGPDDLAADAQPLTAGRQEPQARATTQQTLGHLGGRADHVLAVVEHHHQVVVADHLGEPVRVRQAEGRGDRRRDTGGITDGRQLDQAPAEAELRQLPPARPPGPAASCPPRRGRPA